MQTIIKGVKVVYDGEPEENELLAYVDRGLELHGQGLNKIKVAFDGDYVKLDYYISNKPFQRLRRITGYLVGTLDRWNNGKRAEERDRVKHNAEQQEEEE